MPAGNLKSCGREWKVEGVQGWSIEYGGWGMSEKSEGQCGIKKRNKTREMKKKEDRQKVSTLTLNLR